jgi:hypothetical protein
MPSLKSFLFFDSTVKYQLGEFWVRERPKILELRPELELGSAVGCLTKDKELGLTSFLFLLI